jgi:hypothetical protein
MGAMEGVVKPLGWGGIEGWRGRYVLFPGGAGWVGVGGRVHGNGNGG